MRVLAAADRQDLLRGGDGAGADGSCRPEARAARPASVARVLGRPALSGSPTARCRRSAVIDTSAGADDGAGAGAAPRTSEGAEVRRRSGRRAGTTIAGPLVISQTNATPTRQVARKTRDADRQPAVWISPPAMGSAIATPIPGPA